MYCGNCGSDMQVEVQKCPSCGWINNTPVEPFQFADTRFKSSIPLIMGIVLLVDVLFSYYIIATDTSGWAGLAVIILNVIIVTPILLVLLIIYLVSLKRFNSALSKGQVPPKNVEHIITKYVFSILKFQFKPWKNLLISLVLLYLMLQASIYESHVNDQFYYFSDENHTVPLENQYYLYQQMDLIGDLLNYTYVGFDAGQRMVGRNQYSLNGNLQNSKTHALLQFPNDIGKSEYLVVENYLVFTDIITKDASEKIVYTVNLYNFSSDQITEINHVEVLAKDVGAVSLYQYDQFLKLSQDGFYIVENYDGLNSNLVKYNFTGMSYETPFKDTLGDILEYGNTLYVAHHNQESYVVNVDTFDLSPNSMNPTSQTSILHTNPIYSIYELFLVNNEMYLLSSEVLYNIMSGASNVFGIYIGFNIYARSESMIQQDNHLIYANGQAVYFFDYTSMEYLGSLMSSDFFAVPNADIPVYNGEIITLSEESILYYWDTNLDRVNQDRTNKSQQINEASFYKQITLISLLIWTIYALYKVNKKNQLIEISKISQKDQTPMQNDSQP